MLVKLKITAYSDEHLRSETGTYTVQINPETYKHDFNIKFAEDKGIDTKSPIAKFKTQDLEKINFDFVIDATGVVPGVKSVAGAIADFQKVAYTYKGAQHSPNYLQLVWGDNFVFNCMLESLNIDYQMFSPSGAPLRAKLSVSFRQHLTPEELAKRSKKSSPDLSHARVVSAGTTLPLMAFEVYRDSALYIEVARANDLNTVMHLVEGSEIHFPPVKD